MQATNKNERTCSKGHQYLKGSDCPTWPVCEADRKPADGFLSVLYAPARRALENEGIDTLKKMGNYRITELLSLHGFGKGSIPKLKAAFESE